MSSRLEQLRGLLAVEPSDPFLTYGIALEYSKSEDFAEALKWLEQTIGLDPNYCYAYFQQAKAYSQLGEDALAVAALETGIGVAKAASDSHAVSELTELLASIA